MHQMDSKYKISITGDLGSGKSTVCGIMKEKYGFNVYSIGGIQRALAQKYNMTTLELNKYMEEHMEMDDEIDGALIEISKKDEKMLLDSRMAWHFVPESFKVYLSIDLNIAVQRILSAERGEVEKYSSFEEAKNKIFERKASENFRYLTKYGVDCSDMNNYDLIIDTSYSKPEEIVDVLIAQLEQWKEKKPFNRYWLSPKSLLPTSSIQSGRDGNADDGHAASCSTNESIKVLKKDNLYYITGNHSMVHDALINGISLLPVKRVTEEDEAGALEYVKANCSMGLIHTWEDEHGFTFLRYPNG